jgi:hypothetical protein
MRRLAIVFALLAMISTAIRLITPERVVVAAVRAATAPDRFRRSVSRACRRFTKQLRPLLPLAN